MRKVNTKDRKKELQLEASKSQMPEIFSQKLTNCGSPFCI